MFLERPRVESYRGGSKGKMASTPSPLLDELCIHNLKSPIRSLPTDLINTCAQRL